ncbi:hypothetical protein B0H13DRAFT_2299876 [Mycena leptocephala]|nr:hypothetical protein B0H13DRAFT_2299876 [Mycena leptocephala]
MSLPIFSFSTTAGEVATAFASEIRGKNVLITGTSLNGIGYEAARVIAKYANLVVITGYNIERLKLSEAAIKEDVPGDSQSRIRGQRVLRAAPPAAIGPSKLTVDNLGIQMATDHIGPFLLTKLRAPKLLAASTPSYTPRMVFVSSAAHAFGPGVDFSTVGHPNPEKYTMGNAYSRPKRANILTAIELSKRSKGNINAYSLHPGVIYTNINQKEESIAYAIGWWIFSVPTAGPDNFARSVRALQLFNLTIYPFLHYSTVATAFDTRFDDKPGTYLSSDANGDVAPHCSDPANAEKLWALTEEITGESFTF